MSDLAPGHIWTYVDGELVQVPEADFMTVPEAAPLESQPQQILSGMIELTIENDDITAMQMTAGLGFAMALGPGVYWVFFQYPQPDTEYLVFPLATGFNADVTSRTLEYFEVTVSHRTSGEPTSPTSLQLSVQRVQ